MKRNKVNNKLSWKVTQRCKSYCTFCFAVISNATFFGNSTEFGQIDRNSQQVILCFSGNIVSASINNNFFYVEHESRLKTRFQNSLIKI